MACGQQLVVMVSLAILLFHFNVSPAYASTECGGFELENKVVDGGCGEYQTNAERAQQNMLLYKDKLKVSLPSDDEFKIILQKIDEASNNGKDGMHYMYSLKECGYEKMSEECRQGRKSNMINVYADELRERGFRAHVINFGTTEYLLEVAWSK